MRYKKIVFFSLLAVGLGLCIAGVFVPPLAPVGGTVLLAAVAVGKDRNRQDEPGHQNHPHEKTSESLSPQSSDNLSLDFHVGLHHGHTHHRKDSPQVMPSDNKENVNIKSDHADYDKPRKNVKHWGRP